MIREYNECICKLSITTAPPSHKVFGIQEQYFVECWHILSILRKVGWLSSEFVGSNKYRIRQQYTRRHNSFSWTQFSSWRFAFQNKDQCYSIQASIANLSKLVYATGQTLIETFECLNVLLKRCKLEGYFKFDYLKEGLKES
ncbi:hypothetical protein I9W82_001893 [Candida metapsilosis]|uniref:Uncharacterized protein n=1 Tax=Candida metapsilosis TaxID=273372 RepID=A0A8H7ZDV6_9ASCO|nr:hypothetical protein I9W82_001893 [Candida metapsilosis]